ncbi:hypothetical protein BHE74_00040279 [Ensete ventricosum]|nr:hypothetical protein BHE74_00040279 [Ensete ventricosum]
MIGAAGELDCFNAHIRLREPGKSKDKTEIHSADGSEANRGVRACVLINNSWYTRKHDELRQQTMPSKGRTLHKGDAAREWAYSLKGRTELTNRRGLHIVPPNLPTTRCYDGSLLLQIDPAKKERQIGNTAFYNSS